MLVMHIGPHKTATTYIQHNFREAEDRLATKGWVYPALGAEGLPGHHDLAHNPQRYISGDGNQTEALRTLATQTREEGKNLVVSAEGFCRWGAPRINGFADVTKAEHLDLIYVIRDPLDVFFSYWSEEVKQGYSTSLAERFTENFQDPFSSRLLNPMVDLGKLKSFEKTRLHAVPFELLRARGIDIYEHICETVLGLPDETAASSKAKNISFPVELTEFLRLMTLIEGEGVRRLPNGSDLRLRFMRQSTAGERNELVDLVRTAGADARREIRFPQGLFLKRRLARLVAKGLEENWTIKPTEDQLFKHDEEKTYIHYSACRLTQIPSILEAAQTILDRLKA